MSFRKEFLEDGLLARRIAEVEKQNREIIKKLEAVAGDAYVAWLMAQEQKLPMQEQKNLETQYREADANLEAAQKQAKAMLAGGSDNLIKAGLGKSLEEKKPGGVKEVTKSIRDFTEAEMKKINEHYEKLDGDLKELMNAAIGEGIDLGLARDPVFIRGEGIVYERERVLEILGNATEATCAFNQNIKFKKEDIYPCNTLRKSMMLLLNIIGGADEKAKPLDGKLSSLLEAESRKRVPAELIVIIEKYYQTLIDRRKALFDIICRDPKTKKIMDDPVLLPDGCVYDKTTAEAYLDIYGTCPDSKIPLTKEDITPCFYVIAVLDKLKEIILEKMKQAKLAAAAAANQAKADAVVAPAKKP